MTDPFARSHQTASIITSPLMLSGPLGSGSGFSSVCSVLSVSNLHDPLPLIKEGGAGGKLRKKEAFPGPGGGTFFYSDSTVDCMTHPVSFFFPNKFLNIEC